MEMEEQEKEEMTEKNVGNDAAESTDSKRRISVFYVFRWLVLFPVSFFLAVLTQVSLLNMDFDWLLHFIGMEYRSFLIELSVDMSFFWFGLCFITAGTFIAPDYKKVTSHVMYGICLLLVGKMLINKDVSAPLFLFVGSSLGAYTPPISMHRKTNH